MNHTFKRATLKAFLHQRILCVIVLKILLQSGADEMSSFLDCLHIKVPNSILDS